MPMQPCSAHLFDRLQTGGKRPQALKDLGAQATAARQQVLLINHIEHGQAGSAGERIFFVGVVAQRDVRAHVQSLARDQCGQGHAAATQALANDDHVGLYAVALDGKQVAGAAQRDGDFIEDQQCAMAIAIWRRRR